MGACPSLNTSLAIGGFRKTMATKTVGRQQGGIEPTTLFGAVAALGLLFLGLKLAGVFKGPPDNPQVSEYQLGYRPPPTGL